MGNKTQNKATAQPYFNGNDCVSKELPLMGTYEKRIAKIKANLCYLERNKDQWDLSEVFFLKRYYLQLLKKYQDKITEAHGGIVDELTPQS